MKESKKTNRMLLRACALSLLMLLMGAKPANAQQNGMENAKTAVANMRVGWNLGNTLDSHSASTDNMWIEHWGNGTPAAYETAWGQVPATRELIHMFKEAGFNAIRVPVTWYPHYGTLSRDGLVWNKSQWYGYDVDRVWMNRVKEVVNYVIDEGMYCILNVHHDTGTANTSWVCANMASHNQYQERFKMLWTTLANEFKNYDQHLLFEGYNEMIDKYGSWCYASMSAPGNYNYNDAMDAYNAVNAFAQDFVTTVRATGGNNAQRNLIVNTYAACSGAGNWNEHLTEPLTYMKKPNDSAQNHLIFQIHSYWDTDNWQWYMQTEIDDMFNKLKQNFIDRYDAPVIVGEWGSSIEDLDYQNQSQRQKLLDFAKYFMTKAKSGGFTCFYWMGLSNSQDRTNCVWSEPQLKDVIIKAYYGEGGYVPQPTDDDIRAKFTEENVRQLCDHILGRCQAPEPFSAYDMNKDGKLTNADVSALRLLIKNRR